MNADEVTLEYRRRLDARRATLAARERASFRVSQLRLAIVAAAIVMAAVWKLAALPWLLVPLGVFLSVAFWHTRLLNARDRAASAVAFYERGIARVAGDWVGRGRGGQQYLPADHPYAADLDIFGRGSLFDMLSTTRTSGGDATLARWLLAPADSDVVRERQQAVRELMPRVDLRESVAVMGDVVREEIEGNRVRAWAASPILLQGAGVRIALAALVIGWLSALLWWYETGRLGMLALVLVGVQMLVAQWFKHRVEQVVQGVGEASHDLDVLAELLRLVERERFTSPLLQRLQGIVTDRERAPSREIANLSRRVALLSSDENLVFALPAAMMMWTTQWAFAIDAWRSRTGPHVAAWLDTIGEFEALLAFSTLGFEHPDFTFPEVIDGPPLLSGTAVAHPVLPGDAVANDVGLGEGPLRLIIVSGSNMSGKSTWLRTLGTTVVLAQAGAPVRAAALRLSPLALGAAINLQDSLADGRSRFFAEVRRIGQIVSLSASRNGGVLFLFDEILGGTNSHDRRIGADALLAGLIARGAIGLATTHDLALGEIAERLAPAAANVHFEDRFADGVLTFDYRIRPGLVRTSNALALLRSVGLDV